MKGYEYFGSLAKYGSRPGLERVSRLAELCGRPDKRLGIIHVAGTNGKGSVASAVAAALTDAGYRTGTFMSPYVLDPAECVKVDGVPLTREQFDEEILAVRPFAETMSDDPATEFELQCVAALKYFADHGCELVCLEVGMGGLKDATNFIGTPLVSVICALSLDHTAWLGGSIEQIAEQKCGIIKPEGVAVSYPEQPEAAMRVIRDAAREKHNRLIVPEPELMAGLRRDSLDRYSFGYKGLEFALSVSGRHQTLNAITSVETLFALREAGFAISDKNITNGINSFVLPGRVEIVERPFGRVIIDAGHNLQGVQALCRVLDEMELPEKPVAVAGMLADKDYASCAALLARRCRSLHVAPPESPRALSAEKFAEAVQNSNTESIITSHNNIYEALSAAKAELGSNDTLLICGSFYVALNLRQAALEAL